MTLVLDVVYRVERFYRTSGDGTFNSQGEEGEVTE